MKARWLLLLAVVLGALGAPAARSSQVGDTVVEVSTIDGTYEGWKGDTIYKLTDGHIWQQSLYHYHYHYAYRPEVSVISRGAAYYMVVKGDDEPGGVPVKLLK